MPAGKCRATSNPHETVAALTTLVSSLRAHPSLSGSVLQAEPGSKHCSQPLSWPRIPMPHPPPLPHATKATPRCFGLIPRWAAGDAAQGIISHTPPTKQKPQRWYCVLWNVQVQCSSTEISPGSCVPSYKVINNQ